MNKFENCRNCKYYAKLVKWDYSKLGTGEEWKSEYDGYACAVFAFTGEHYVVHMVGENAESGLCEMFYPANKEDVEKWKSNSFHAD